MEFTPARPYKGRKGYQIVSSTPVEDGASHDSGYASFVLQRPRHDSLSVDSPYVEPGKQPHSQGFHEEDSLLDDRTPKLSALEVPKTCLRSASCKRRDQRGRLHVDFLKELRPFQPILVKLLSMLDDRDLAAVCRTSATWRSTCLSVKVHAARWRRYIGAKRDVFQANKENLPQKKFHRERSGTAEPLSTVNSGPTVPEESTVEKEPREAHRQNEEPRAVSGRGLCTEERASRPVVSPVPCERKQHVGSKASKRNLQRL